MFWILRGMYISISSVIAMECLLRSTCFHILSVGVPYLSCGSSWGPGPTSPLDTVDRVPRTQDTFRIPQKCFKFFENQKEQMSITLFRLCLSFCQCSHEIYFLIFLYQVGGSWRETCLGSAETIMGPWMGLLQFCGERNLDLVYNLLCWLLVEF